jgi:hypothetical protein
MNFVTKEEVKERLKEIKQDYSGSDGHFPDTQEGREKLMIELLSLIVQLLAL